MSRGNPHQTTMRRRARPAQAGRSTGRHTATQLNVHGRPVWVLRDGIGILSMATTEDDLYDGFINGQRRGKDRPSSPFLSSAEVHPRAPGAWSRP
jgi:hypothetical protein